MLELRSMRIDILTLFPGMFLGPLQHSILKRAQQRGLLQIFLHQLRDYALDRHQMTDDVPYGGTHGMLLKPEPIFEAVVQILGDVHVPIILLTPQGRTFTHQQAQALAKHSQVLFLSGHYEGVDERVRQHLVTHEISIGDYVLTGGELATMVVVDAVARFIPGVLGAKQGAHDDSYATGLLEGPQYTRPMLYKNWTVPEVVRSGHHKRVAQWKRECALQRTWERRPDLLTDVDLSPEDRAFLLKIQSTFSEP